MTYRELDYKATRLLDNDKITLGEYEEKNFKRGITHFKRYKGDTPNENRVN